MNTTKVIKKRAVRLSILATLALAAAFSACAQNGTWTNLVSGNGSGSWAAATNWNSAVIAAGADNTADFSTLDLAGGSTVTLDAAWTIGNLIVADATPTTNWTFNASGTNATLPVAYALTLAASSGQPVINVSNQVATFNAAIFANNGFVKAGAGTLRFNNANTNASGWLNGTVIVSNGVLQCGNTSLGANGNQNGTNRVVVTNGATLEVISGIAVNNKHLTISGPGLNGTQGAIYANPATNTTSTRWGLSTVNDSGTSANSSASFPAITLAADSTVRVDGANPTYSFLAGFITSGANNFTLTKTGTGKLSLERGANVSNIVIQAGSVSPNAANSFNGIANWTVNAGGLLLNNQNQTFNSANISLLVNAGGTYDADGRGNGAVGSDTTTYTQSLGNLNGAGTITSGTMGNTGAQTLNVSGTASNCVFSGTITVSNGILNLGKTGAGTTLTLSGTNNYNGVTTISGGTLLVDGRHVGGSNYVVAAGATLGGRGTIFPFAPNTINLSGNLVAGETNGGTLIVSNVAGAGNVIVSNANLVVFGQINSSVGGNYLTSLYLTNGAITALLQQNGTEASVYATSVNIDGTNNILSFTTANPATGQFPFIKYNGTIGGLNGFAGLNLQAPSGITGYLSNNIANASIDIVVTGIPALVWQGTPNGNWTIGGSANWLNGATPSAYTETAGSGPFVIFDDTAPGATSVNVAANVTPKGITVTGNSRNYVFSGAGSIGGNGSIVKSGASTVTFANTNALAGTITVNGGALAIGNGGSSGSVGSASIVNSSQIVFNRSDDVTIANAISGSGSLVKNNTDTVTLTGVGDIGGSIAANGGTLALSPSGTVTVSGDVTGAGAFGINGVGTVRLSSGNITYGGGSLIAGGGTLEFDSAFPPSGNVTDNGTLAFGASGTFGDNISGAGGLTLLNGANVTLAGANSYSGATTVVANGALTANAANYPHNSLLILGSTAGASDIGSATFAAGDPVIGGLMAGGNSQSPGDPVTLAAGSAQTLTVSGSVFVGNSGPVGASVYLPVTGTSASLTVNTNGGVIQIGLGSTSSGVNPDNVLVDLSAIDNFTANLGVAGTLNMGTLDGNPGPPSGATVVNQFKLANISNSITAGTLMVGAGGRQLVPELFLGPGTNVINVNTNFAGGGGRDGSYIHFASGTGGLRLRAADGSSRAIFNVGVNPGTGTGASITNTVDFTGHPVDLLLSTLLIGDYNNAGYYQNTFSFDTGLLDASATSLSVLRNNNGNAAASGSTLNINGGMARLGPVTLTASAAYGTLNIANATVASANISAPGSGVSTLSIANSTWSLTLTNFGNPAAAPVFARNFSAAGTVSLGVNGTNWTVGSFPLISYTGSIGGDGYPALSLASLPTGVTGYLSNDVANLAVDLVVTSAPPTINANPPVLQVNPAGNTLSLGWPTNRGWILQSNSVGLTASSAWFNYPADGSVGVTNVIVGIQPGKPNVFFRMVKP